MAMSETEEEAVASISSTFKTFIRSPGIPEHTGQPFEGVKPRVTGFGQLGNSTWLQCEEWTTRRQSLNGTDQLGSGKGYSDTRECWLGLEY